MIDKKDNFFKITHIRANFYWCANHRYENLWLGRASAVQYLIDRGFVLGLPWRVDAIRLGMNFTTLNLEIRTAPQKKNRCPEYEAASGELVLSKQFCTNEACASISQRDNV